MFCWYFVVEFAALMVRFIYSTFRGGENLEAAKHTHTYTHMGNK